MYAGVPNAAWPRRVPGAVPFDRLQAGAEQRDQQLDEHRSAEQRAREAQRAARGGAAAQALAERAGGVADVGDDEHVQHHHGAGVDDDLRGGDEFGAQQQEQHGEREQVDDEREHGEEGVAQRDHADRAGDGAERGEEEQQRAHCSPGRFRPLYHRRTERAPHSRGAAFARTGRVHHHSPSRRSGVRSSGSASSISLVKIRSERE